MSAAKYIGRVGGLAIALGVGVAIMTGQGAASASTGSDSQQSTNASSAQPGAGGAPDAGTPSGGGVGAKPPHRAGMAGRLGGVVVNPASTRERPKSKRGSDAREKRVAEVKADIKRATDAASEGGARPGKKSAKAKSSVTDIAPAGGAIGHTLDAADTTIDAEVDTTPAAKQPAQEWRSSRRVTAVATAPSEAVAPSAGPTAAPQLSVATGQADALAQPTVARVLTTVANDVLNPSSGTDPVLPLGGAPGDLLLLAATRRELSSAAVTADVPSYDIAVSDGVIGGCVLTGCPTTSGSGLPVTYTVVSAPDNGGKVSVNGTTGKFTFLPYTDPDNMPSGQESFTVFVAERTAFDDFVTGLPLVGSALFAPVIMILQQVPVISVVLAPVIGGATRQTVTADIDGLILQNGGAPIAYTTMVRSFDGTKISTNFFPAIGPDTDGQPGYETIFNAPGLANPGATDPTDFFVQTFRYAGYNVVTWDPRGEFDSGGVLQLDNPQFEGRDVSALIDWVATRPGVELDSAATATTSGDPRMGMVGVSYGGGIQLVTAANDKRVDAIAPGFSWNSLPDSFYPDEAFKTSYASLLLLGLVTSGARINDQIFGGIALGDLLGVLTASQVALLAASGPAFTVRDIEAPTLLIQGTVDVLFPLEQSVVNAGYLTTPYFAGDPTATTKMVWMCGGHGDCLPGQGDDTEAGPWMLSESLAWMNRYVKEDGSTDAAVFEWTDQNGTRWSSDTLPSDPAFYSADVINSTGAGQLLPIIPILGGSGPQTLAPLPYSLGDGSMATNAVTIELTNPVTEQNPDPVNVVGAPTLTMSYSGVGTSRHVYAQIVDVSTGLVVGNIVTPIPVTLDGNDQQVTIPLNDIAYTLDQDSQLEVQIFTTATAFLNLTQYGFINISTVSVDLPIAGNAVQEGTAVFSGPLVAV